MPRPKKIKKKKSFMFTTKHQSENGIISLFIGAISLAVAILSIIYSFLHRGDIPQKTGAVGMFAALGDLIGIIAAVIGLRERDIFVWVPRTGLIVNIVMLLIWGVMVSSALFFGQ